MRIKDDKKQEAIVNAAVTLITEFGFEDTSISKIAKQANVSPATIYIYFKNKDELLKEVFLKCRREMSSAMLEGLDEEMPVDEAFKLVWHNFYRYALENRSGFAFVEQFTTSPLVRRLDKDEALADYEELARLFERGKREGIFKDIPLAVFSAFAFFPVIGLVRQRYGENLVFGEKILGKVYRLTWEAVSNDGA